MTKRKVVLLAGMGMIGSTTLAAQVGTSFVVVEQQRSGKTASLPDPNTPIGQFHRDQAALIAQEIRAPRRQKHFNKPKSKFHK